MKICYALACAMLATTCFAEYRTWTNSEGKQMTAEFVRFEGTTVLLKRKKNGAIRRVSLKKFSEADKSYLKKRSGFPGKESAKTWSDPQSGTSISARIEQAPEWLIGCVVIGMLVINIPLIILIGRGLFGDMNGFMDAIRFWFQPDWISCWRGEWGADWIAEFKLGLFMILSAGLFVVEGMIVFSWLI